ncbi:uncharacterized protein LOC114414123 [Glycine soja]|uniref:uncharacterized mitochondrial protein AtMg00810-like n=1 Tax=Glycine max TaxID=3847 RepID=UPI0003DED3D9|nr:uncharacterized mitochondrial protein AtMg00810-like [Glycine max]XP_028234269.1 uncharacterized protein LOC114414123 [Glycine soja]|eukprot:XP_006582472.1 uncharacterized protein LOC102667731 [Glycine max]
MSDLGELSYFLGIEFVSTSKWIFMHQKKYAEHILKRFNMMECNSVITPTETGIKLQIDGDEKEVDPTMYKQIVGSLRYLCNTRPNIAYCVGLISRFMEKPKTPHFLAAKRILRYVKGTLDVGILYPYSKKNYLVIVIQIGVVIRMIGKSLLGMFSNLEQHQSFGAQRSRM